jgi:hypothetical protein
MKHTPGPWKIHTFAQLNIVSANTGLLVASCADGWTGQGNEREANAALIAAAPDLLAALQLIANSEEYDGDSFVCDFATLQGVARAAIAKACPQSQELPDTEN